MGAKADETGVGQKPASDLDLSDTKGLHDDTEPIDSGIEEAKNGLDDLEKGLKDL